MWLGLPCPRGRRFHWLHIHTDVASAPDNHMRLVTFEYQGQQEIGALTEADSKIIRLQNAEQLRAGETNPHFQSMLAFLQGGSASRDAAERTIEFALSQHPKGATIDRASASNSFPLFPARNRFANSWCLNNM